jgi:hypothetical protein
VEASGVAVPASVVDWPASDVGAGVGVEVEEQPTRKQKRASFVAVFIRDLEMHNEWKRHRSTALS